jgi:hypothetical protein
MRLDLPGCQGAWKLIINALLFLTDRENFAEESIGRGPSPQLARTGRDTNVDPVDPLALDEALKGLETLHPHKAQLITRWPTNPPKGFRGIY